MSDRSPVSSDAAPASTPAEIAATWRPADSYGYVQRAGARLRYARWNAPGTPRGSVVLLQGRAEFIEKYSTEVVGELLSRGFSVFAVDLRGQGLSDRPLPDHDKGHVDDFDTYVADLDQFLTEIVAPVAPRPILALSHSTSGNILLRYLTERGAGPFAASFCVSPMTGLCRALPIALLTRALSPFGVRDTAYMAWTGPYDRAHRRFEGNDVTSDETRYRFTDLWFRADPRLSLGGPTIGWLKQAQRSIDRLISPGTLERISVPLTVMSASGDRVVDIASHAAVVARVRGATHCAVAGAKHEILMETDPRRAQFWAAFDRVAASLG